MSVVALVSSLLLAAAGPDLFIRQQDQGIRVPDVAVTGRTPEEAVREFVDRVAAPPRGRGVARKDGARGDLLVTVEVQVPTELDDAQRAAVTAYREARGDADPRAALDQDRAQGRA